MKFVRNLILVLALSLPGYALAEADSIYTPEEKPSSYKPMFFGLEIGAGSVFVAGLEWGFSSSLIYSQERPEGTEGLWTPDFEVGYLVNKEQIYVNAIFTLSLPRIGLFDP